MSVTVSDQYFNFTPCPEQKHPKHYRLSLEKGISNYNNFNTIISGTAGHQTTVQHFALRNVYFCTTWGKQNQRNMS